MIKLLVSSCLLGERVRYDNKQIPCTDPRLLRWLEQGRIIPVCPEVAGGLPTPRPPAQVQGDRVRTEDGTDVTAPFELGAQHALALAQEYGIRWAVLKQSSPSCGSKLIYDGSFSGVKIPGEGRTTALLRRHGITVYGEEQLDEVEALMELYD